MSVQDFELGRGQHLAGALDRAWDAYQRAAAACHADPAYWLWLALLAAQIGQGEPAAACLQQAASLGLSEANARWDELSPQLTAQACDLIIAEANHLPTQAVSTWLLALDPHLPPAARLVLWRWLLESGSVGIETLETRLETGKPNDTSTWAEGWNLLASLLMRSQHSERATAIWQSLTSARPDFAPAQLQLGHLALEQARPDDAISHYQRALSLDPVQPELHYHLGRISLSLLEHERADSHFKLALEQAARLGQDHPLWQVQQAMATSPLSDEPAPQLEARLVAAAKGMTQAVDLLACQQDLLRGGIEPGFDLNYLSENDGPVRSAFADIFIAPAAPRWPEPSTSLRLGVAVTPGHEGLFLFGSQHLLQALAAAGLEILLLVLPASIPKLQPLAHGSSITIQALAPELAAAAAQVQALELDLVYYWESGTDPINYFLPMFQLARVQFTSWGSVSTTGLPQMQYFLSAAGLETPESSSHYREQLELLPVLPMLYTPEMLTSSGKDRLSLGLPDAALEAPLLGCPHNPQKLSPGFLAALGEILAAVPQARLVLIESRHPAWQRAFASRLLAALGPAAARAIWLPRLASEDFTALLGACDLLLDPFSFGSGKLAFESLGLGRPLLTLPGRRLRGRIASACYRQIDFESLIAASAADYVSKAISLLKDAQALKARSDEIISRRHLLMQHPQVLPSILSALTRMATYSRSFPS